MRTHFKVWAVLAVLAALLILVATRPLVALGLILAVAGVALYAILYTAIEDLQ